jgi:hypothetical protein
MDFLADVIGDEVLTQWQPVLVTALSVSERRSLKIRFGALLPGTDQALAKHRLIALMWQKDALLREKSRKRAKGRVGAAYRLSKDTISKWRGPCTKELGVQRVEEALAQVGEIEPRHYFPFVFGEAAGAKTLSACVKAYQDCLRVKRGLSMRGRPEKIEA